MQRGGDSAEREGKHAAGPQETRGEAKERGKVETGGPVWDGSGDGDDNSICYEKQCEMASGHGGMVAEAEASGVGRSQCRVEDVEMPGVPRMEKEP